MIEKEVKGTLAMVKSVCICVCVHAHAHAEILISQGRLGLLNTLKIAYQIHTQWLSNADETQRYTSRIISDSGAVLGPQRPTGRLFRKGTWHQHAS